MNDTTSRSQFRASLVVFMVSLLFSFLAWDSYFNSENPLDRSLFSHFILAMGLLFSVSVGLLVRSLELRHDELKVELREKVNELLDKTRELQQAEVKSTAMYELCFPLFSSDGLKSLLDKAMELTGTLFNADEGSLMLIDSKNKLYIAAGRGISMETSRKVHLDVGERVAGLAVQQKREFLINGGLENYMLFRGIEGNPLIRSSLVCPISFGEQVLGVLNMNRTATRDKFTAHDVKKASVFATLVGHAIYIERMRVALSEKSQELKSSSHPSRP
ncbi:MAG: GAF domain-containing protein [Candidatus Omnitrophota bacterium]|nr:GAF domain-containing protein [Candidatus Omnitrophota bacterium]